MEENNRLPTIRIKHAILLEPYFQVLKTTSQWKEIWGDIPYPPEEEIYRKIETFRAAWKQVGESVLKNLQELSGLHFQQRIIDVYIIGLGRAKSDPMMISSHLASDEFVDVLTHELIHRLLSDNREGYSEDEISPQLYSELEPKVAIHVVVHAIHGLVYERIFDSSRQKLDYERCTEDYRRAWDIAQSEGFGVVVDKFLKAALKNRPSMVG